MKSRSLAILTIVLLPLAASAQGYAVIAGGLAELSTDCTGASACDKTDVGIKVVGGYKITPSFAGEVAYFNFGKASASAGAVSGEVKNSAIGGGVAYHADGTESHFVARLGLASVKTKASGAIAGVGSASDSDSNLAVTGGIGAGYKWSKRLSIDAAWDATRAKYNKNGVNQSGTINFFSIGATMWF